MVDPALSERSFPVVCMSSVQYFVLCDSMGARLVALL